MPSRKEIVRTALLSGIVAVALAIPAAASAQLCASNADCVKGTSCQVTSSGGTVSSTGPACPKGELDCAAASVPTPTTTPPPTVMQCQPLPCRADSDCATGMVCHTESATTCSGGGSAVSSPCPPNTICPPLPAPEPTTCTTTTTSLCTFKWQLPCNTDAECGDAFTCEIGCEGIAAGGGSVGSGAGGATTVSTGKANPSSTSANDVGVATAPPVCTPSFPGWCQARATRCTADADCPADWSCVAAPVPVAVPGGSGPGSTAVDVTVAPTSGTPPMAVVKVCQSPAGFGVKGGTSAGGSDASSGSSTPTTGANGGNGGNAGNVGTTSGPTPTKPGATPPTNPETASPSGASSGCRAVAGGQSSMLGLGVLGLLLALGTRRRR